MRFFKEFQRAAEWADYEPFFEKGGSLLGQVLHLASSPAPVDQIEKQIESLLDDFSDLLGKQGTPQRYSKVTELLCRIVAGNWVDALNLDLESNSAAVSIHWAKLEPRLQALRTLSCANPVAALVFGKILNALKDLTSNREAASTRVLIWAWAQDNHANTLPDLTPLYEYLQSYDLRYLQESIMAIAFKYRQTYNVAFSELLSDAVISDTGYKDTPASQPVCRSRTLSVVVVRVVTPALSSPSQTALHPNKLLLWCMSRRNERN